MMDYIPSKDFSDDAYSFFLQFASLEELETDTTTVETAMEIAKLLGCKFDKFPWENCLLKDT